MLDLRVGITEQTSTIRPGDGHLEDDTVPKNSVLYVVDQQSEMGIHSEGRKRQVG